MKKLITLLIPVLLFASGTTYGQVSAYSFTQSTSTYTSLTSATVLGSGTGLDDGTYANTPIGFDFVYNGKVFNTVGSISCNGYLLLGATGSWSYTPISSTNTATGGSVSAIGRDIRGADAGTELRYKTEGTAPNRTFTVEWYHFQPYGTTYNGCVYTFSITLDEYQGKIHIKYDGFTHPVSSSVTCQVGIRGQNNTDYNNRTTTTDWTATTLGGSNSATCTLATAVVPPTGLVFNYAAPLFTAPLNFAATTFSSSQINLSWLLDLGGDNVMILANTTGSFTNPTNLTPYNVGDVIGTGSSAATVIYSGNGTSFSHTGLNYNTTYYYRAYSYSGILMYSGYVSSFATTQPPSVPATNFTAIPISTTEIDQSWSLNAFGHNVILVYNTTGTFTAPVTGTSYPVGSVIGTGGSAGTVIYNGNGTSFAHTGLTPATTYYYALYSYDPVFTYYSTSVTANATTICLPSDPPYAESFEGITANNTLPVCWSATNFTTKTKTYISTQGTGRTAHTGVKYATFEQTGSSVTAQCNDFFFTNKLHLVAGAYYKTSIWYVTYGYSGWSQIALKWGTSATYAAMTNTIAVQATPVNTTYQKLEGTFTVPVTGDYYVGVFANGLVNYTPYYMSWDDFSLTLPSNFKAVSPAIDQMNISWDLNATNDPVLLVYNTVNTFGTPITGVNYSPGNTLGGGGTVLYNGTATSFLQSGLTQNTTYYYRLWTQSGDPITFAGPDICWGKTQFAVGPPQAFAATTVSGTSINLTWTGNAAGNPVIIVNNTADIFGTPVDGSGYAVGTTIPGGGNVVFNGTGTSFLNTGLLIGTAYYYRIYNYNGALLYSDFLSANAQTLCDIMPLPVTQDFGADINSNCWDANYTTDPLWKWEARTSELPGTYVTITPKSGAYFAYYDAWDAPAGDEARLASPSLNLSAGAATHPILSLWHTTTGYTNFSGGGLDYIQPQYSYDNGVTWFNLGPPLSEMDLSLPNDMYAPGVWRNEIIALDALVGHPNVKIGFLAISAWGSNLGIDLVKFKELGTPVCATNPTPADEATGVVRNIGNISWASAEDATHYEVYFGESATSLSLIGDVTTTYIAIPAMAANTQYFWKVIPKNQYYSASDCPVWSFTTGNVLIYCASSATSTADEDIENVTFNTINNTSPSPTCAMYTDYTNISTTVIKGFTYPISVTKLDCEGSGFYSFGLTAFIDFNQNGQWDLPSEQVWLSTYGGSGLNPVTRTGDITIPADAVSGPTRMRVVLVEFTANPSPCGTYTWGETEDYTVNIIPYDKDLKILSWESPSDACNLTANEAVTVTYTNLANETQNNYELAYFNGTSWVNEVVTTPIATGEVLTYTFNTLADFSAPGEYLCKAAVVLAGDLMTNNDTTGVIKVRNYPVIEVTDEFVQPVPGPYSQNFDEGDAYWFPNGLNNAWELGTPTKTFLNAPASTPNSWVTKLSEAYPDNSYSWVESPCFDLSTLLNPIIELNIRYQTAPGDGALLMSNIDGAGWTVVGDLYQLTNWYGSTAWNGLPVWGGQSTGNGYLNAKHQIVGGGGQSNVKLAVLFISDNAGNGDGFSFDDVKIYESPVLFANFPQPGLLPSINIEGPPGAILDLRIKGGVPPYHVLWSPAAGLYNNDNFCGVGGIAVNCQKPIAIPDETTIYTAKVWDSKEDKVADTVWASIKVNVYPPLTVDARWDATVCDTAYTQIYAMATGGVPPYTYQWDNVATLTDGTIYDPVANPTSTTTYNVTVTDAIGFVAYDQVTITTVSGYPVVDIHPNGATICLGDALQLTATGGTDYLWSVYPPSQASTISSTTIANPWVSPTISGVKYTCMISSPCGTASDFVIINVEPKPVATWTTFSPSHFCEYEETPVLLTGGTPAGGTYSGDGVHDGYFTPSIAGVGTHTITYTYINPAVNNCPGIATFDIVVYPKPSMGLHLTTPIHCLNESPFVITGGQPAVIGQDWIPGGVYSGTGVTYSGPGDVIANFDPAIGIGKYPITFTYTSPVTGCTDSRVDTIFVFEPSIVEWNWDTAICVNSLPIQLHGGNPAGGVYSGAGVVSSPFFDPAIAGVGEHTLYYNYINDDGCNGVATSVITVNPLPTIPTELNNSTICAGETVSETITLTGTPPWTIEWTVNGVLQVPIVADATPYFLQCTPNVESAVSEYALVSVTDANGCSNTPTTTWTIFSNPTPLPYHVVMNDPDGRYCYGQEGIAVGCVASEPGMKYELFKDGVFTGSTFIGPADGSQFWFVPHVTAPGVYTVKAISDLSPTFCENWMANSVTIGVDTLQVNLWTEFDSICLGGTSLIDAYLVNPQVSAGPFTFDWAPLADLSPNGFTTVLAHPLVSETFTVTVSDGTGCSATASTFITVNTLPEVTINTDPYDIICDGSGVPLVVNVTYGSSNTIEQYLWDPTTNLDLTDPSAPIASPHVATAYTVVVVDGFGCEGSATHDVLVTPSPNVAFAGPNSVHICPNGSVTIPLLAPTVGTGPFTYLWSPAVGLNDVTAMNPICTVTQTTTYTVSITDEYSNCTGVGTYEVIVNNGMLVQLGDNFDICLGTSANLFANVTNGVDPLSFVWSSNPALPIAPVQNPSVTPNALGTTIVTVTVTDYYGCTATDNVAITAGNVPVAHAGPNDTICEGQCTTLMGSGGTSYQWFVNGLPISLVTSFPYLTVCPQATTTYELRVTSPCGAALSYVTVVVNPATPLAIDFPQTEFCQNGPSVTISGSPLDANGVFSGTGITDLGNGTATFTPSTVGVNYITYTYTNQWGCVYSITESVNVKELPPVCFDDIADVCLNTPDFVLSAGNCSPNTPNGIFSGVGVSGGIFHPAIAGVGEHTITYTVTGANGCTNSASINVMVNGLPDVFNASVSNNGVYCNYPNATGVEITLDGSQQYSDHITYTLILNGFTTGITLHGTGSTLVFTNITAIGQYQVLATSEATGCNTLMNGIMNVTLAPLPIAYNVTGGGAYCQNGEGVAVGLDNSNYGVTYYLYRNNSYTGISHAGVNGPFDFSTFATLVGTYTVYAVDDNTGCEKVMNGSVDVTTYPLPFPYFVYVGNSGAQSITACPGTVITIRQNANECGVIYELYHNGTPTGLTRTCANGASFTWVSNSFAPGVYTVVGTRITTGCKKQMNGSATINYYIPVSVLTNPLDQFIDDGGDAIFSVTATGYNPGYQWEVQQNGVGAFTPISNGTGPGPYYNGVNTNTLEVYNAPYDNWTKNKYRVKVSGPCNNVYSAPATLYIDPIVNVTIPQMTECAADTIFVPIVFTHADSINAISLTITYDNTNFTFVNPALPGYPGYKDLNPQLNAFNLSILGIGNTIRISYFDLTGSINNGYVLPFDFLKLGFKAINAGGTSHPLHFVTSIPGACELSKISGEILTTNFVDGNVNVIPLPVIVSAGAVDNDVCQHDNVYLTAVGTHPLGVSYTWAYPPSYTPITTETGQLTISDVSPDNSGVYYLTVSSLEWGCQKTTSFEVTVRPEPNQYSLYKPNGDSACAGSGVEIALDGSQVDVSYALYLEPNNVTPVVIIGGTGNPITFGPQPVTGTYVVKATSSYGCTRWMANSASIHIYPLPLWFNVLGGGHYCAGGTGREIRLSGSQLGVQYTLLLNACCCQADSIIQTVVGTGSPISFGLHLTPGYYSVVAVNPNTGCQNNMIGCVPIVIDPLPTAHLIGGGTSCSGTPATLQLNLTGRAPWTVVLTDGTTEFTLSPINTATYTFTVNPTTTTTYSIVSVKDANNCTNTGTGTATITVVPLPELTAGSNSPVCLGSALHLTATATGTAPFAFAWSGPFGFVSTDQNPIIPVSTMDNNGYYTVTVTDGNGCVKTAEVHVVVNPLPTIGFEANSPCVGTVLNIYAIAGGTGPFTYSWTGPNNYTGTGNHVMIENVTEDNEGDYTVTVTDGNGCVNVSTVTIVVNPLPEVTCLGGIICAGETIHLFADATGNGPFTYYWTGPEGFTSNEQNPTIPNAQVINSGTYTVSVYDAHQCVGTCGAGVIVNPLPQACEVLITQPNVYCFGCVPPQISLGCSESNVTYTLYLNGVATTNILIGTGQPINFGPISVPGFYTVHAVNNITGCTNWMFGTVEVIEQAPPTATITGDVICAGETAHMNVDLTGDTYWTLVIYDGVNKDTIHVASSPFDYIPGAGPHILAPVATTTYTILLVSDRVCYNVGNSATVVVNPLPNKYNMTGGGYYCNNIGVNVGLNGSQVGINYTLHKNGFTLNTVAGTGAPISFGPQSDGVYWAEAINPLTGCSAVMNGQAIVEANPNLLAHNVSGGGSYCFGGTGVSIFLDGSQSGKEYKLLKDGIYTGITIIGTGNPITFNNVMDPGVYTVLLFDPITTCTKTMNGSATVVQRPLPSATISGNATICYGDVATLHVVLTGTAPWTFVISELGGINSVVHHSAVPTFDTIVNPTSTKNYIITTVVDAYCQNIGLGSALVTVNSPIPYVVTGGGAYCAGGQGVVIGLSGSQVGVNYTLLLNGVGTGVVIAGTGNPISFGYLTDGGNYTVVATSTIDGCSRTMNGVAVITLVPLPTIYQVTGGGACCVGCTHVFVCVSGSQDGMRYELYINGQYTGIYKTPHGGDFCYDYASVAGVYTVKAVDVSTGCWAWMDGSATVVLYPTAQANITGGGTICLGQPATLTVTFTEGTAPFSFGLSVNGTVTTYDNITTNPYTFTVTPGVLPTNVWNYTLAWVSDVYGCYNNITTGLATVVVTTPDVITFDYEFGPYCADHAPVTLGGGHPTGGIWSGVGVENGEFNPALAGAGSHVITYTYTNQVGCQSVGYRTIVVYALPNVTITQLGTYCVGGPAVPIVGTPAGGYFVGPAGLVDLGGGNATFSPLFIGGPYTITYVYTSPQPEGCTNSAFTTATVVALEPVDFTGLGGEYCLNDAMVELTGVPDGGIFSGPGIVNGHFFDPAVAGAGTWDITYSLTNNSNCVSSMTKTVVVHPLPQLCAFEGGGICCIGCSVNGFLGCSQIGVSYQLVRNGNLNVGAPKLGTGFGLVWEIFLGGTYHIVATDIATGCSVASNETISVDIIPQPTATISGSTTICTGQSATLTVTLTGTPPFEVWFSDGTDTVVYHNITGYVWTHEVQPLVTTTYSVVSLTDEYCGAFGSGSATVTVNPMPEIFDVTGGGTICMSDNQGVSIGLSGSQVGVYYELFLGTTSVDVHSGTGSAFNFGTFTEPGVYTVKSTSLTTCVYPMNGSATIDLWPEVPVSLPAFNSVCQASQSFALTGGEPLGGVYFVDNIEISYFDPEIVGPGLHEIRYDYTDVHGCIYSAYSQIEVYEEPDVQLASFAPVCFNAPEFALTGGTPDGGVYMVNGVVATVFDPEAYGQGNYIITYVYTDAHGCSAVSPAQTLTVLPLTVVHLPQFPSVFLNADPIVLTGGTPAGGEYSGDHVSNGMFFPVELGTFVITYTYTDNCGTYTATSEIEVVEGAIYNITGQVTYDNNVATVMNNITVHLTSGGTTIDAQTDANGNYAFNLLAPGTYTVSASSTKPWGGVNSADALLIMKHFVGITPLTGLRLLAADVNGLNGVNSVDALLCAKRFVNQINSFPVGDWIFEVKDVTIVNSDQVNNFKALCYGDVNGTYTPPYVKTPATVHLNTYGVKEIKSYESFELPINVTSTLKVGAISLVINYPENLVDVEGVVVNSPSANFLYTAINGELRISWYNMKEMTLSAKDVLLTLQLRSRNISSASASELTLTLDGVSELNDKNATILQDVNLTYPKLAVAVEEYSISNYPNPFKDVTEIVYNLPESGKVTLKVYNLLGDVVSVLVNNVEQAANTYKVTFDGTNLVPGIYTYKIEVNGQTKEFVKSGMMVLSK